MHLTKRDGNTDLLNVEKATLQRVAQQALSQALEHQKPKFELHGPREQVSSSRESLGKRQGNYLTNQKPLEGAPGSGCGRKLRQCQEAKWFG